jgi:hypothetical protein
MKIQIVKKAQKKAAPNGCTWVVEGLVEPRK